MKLSALFVLALVVFGGAAVLYLTFKSPESHRKPSEKVPHSEELRIEDDEDVQPIVRRSEDPRKIMMEPAPEKLAASPEKEGEEAGDVTGKGPRGKSPLKPKDGEKKIQTAASEEDITPATATPPSVSPSSGSGEASPSSAGAAPSGVLSGGPTPMSPGGLTFPALPPAASAPSRPVTSSPRSTATSSGPKAAAPVVTPPKPIVPAPAASSEPEKEKTLAAVDPKDVAKPKTGTEPQGDRPAEKAKTEEVGACLEHVRNPPREVPTSLPMVFSSDSVTAAANASEKKLLWVFAKTASFRPNETLVLQLLRECEEARVETVCDTKVPSGGPAFDQYAMGASMAGSGVTGIACMRDDANPETREIADVGTVTRVVPDRNPEVEAILGIHVGTVPGKYRLTIANERITLTKTFDVLAAPPPSSALPHQ